MLRRKARQHALIARTGGFLIPLFFYLGLFFLGCGLLYENTASRFRDYWGSLPWFSLWETVRDFLKIPGGSLGADLTKGVLLIYAVSLLLFLLLAVFFRLVYHPRKAPLPGGDYAENAALLVKQAKEARDYAFRSRVNASVVAAVLAITALVVLFLGYIFYMEDAAAVTGMLSRFPTSDVNTNCLLYVLALYVLCGASGGLLMLLARPLYRFDFPYELVVQAQKESFAVTDDPKLADLPALREEALALERSGAYGVAMDLLHKAAVCGDVPAMEHYARHCLLRRMTDSARYWLKQCVSSESPSPLAKKWLWQLRLGLRPDLHYLRPEQAPPSMGKKIGKAILGMISLVWKTFMLLLLIAVVLFMFLYFGSGTNPELLDKLPPEAAQWITDLRSMGGSAPAAPAQTEPKLQVPTMTLSLADTKWEHNPAVTQETSGPVVFCYSKEAGGNLYIPYFLDGRDKIQSAGLYTGNKWNLQRITKHITCDPRTNTLTVAEEFLMGLESGESYIILDDWCYVPLLVSEAPVSTPQIGLAAVGDEHNRIPFDLEDPQDITLSFYNLGSDRIVSLSQMHQIVMTPKATILPLEPGDYSIAPDGHSVTLSADFLAAQEAGFSMGFQAELESGHLVDTGYLYVGICRGDFTGLMEIQGEDTYSLSKGGDYTARYTFGLTGSPMHLHVQQDGEPPFIEDDLMDLMSEYIDLDAGTITLPEALLKEHLTEGSAFTIGISYGTAFGHSSHSHLRVEVKK